MSSLDIAVAFLQFKAAFSTLKKVLNEVDDIDVSDIYPFYLLDFDKLEQPVAAWCNL